MTDRRRLPPHQTSKSNWQCSLWNLLLIICKPCGQTRPLENMLSLYIIFIHRVYSMPSTTGQNCRVSCSTEAQSYFEAGFSSFTEDAACMCMYVHKYTSTPLGLSRDKAHIDSEESGHAVKVVWVLGHLQNLRHDGYSCPVWAKFLHKITQVHCSCFSNGINCIK